MYLINIFCKIYIGDDIKEVVINNFEGLLFFRGVVFELGFEG